MRIALPWILELTLRKYTEPLNQLFNDNENESHY
jgi:hypothetical protein